MYNEYVKIVKRAIIMYNEYVKIVKDDRVIYNQLLFQFFMFDFFGKTFLIIKQSSL